MQNEEVVLDLVNLEMMRIYYLDDLMMMMEEFLVEEKKKDLFIY